MLPDNIAQQSNVAMKPVLLSAIITALGFASAAGAPMSKVEREPNDEDVLWYGIDRVHHEKTEPNKEPTGQLSEIHQGLERFRKLHEIMLDYARTTDDDLRGHAMPEWGTDAYQCLLGISTHDQRHILQIREIKADSAFPKK
jgi:hypothetical protein